MEKININCYSLGSFMLKEKITGVSDKVNFHCLIADIKNPKIIRGLLVYFKDSTYTIYINGSIYKYELTKKDIKISKY